MRMIYATCVTMLLICGDTRAESNDYAPLSVVDGRYIRLQTDLPESDQLHRFVDSFDEAVKQWVKYFNRELTSIDGWRVNAYLMSEKAVFIDRELIPSSLPDFLHGYQLGDQLWVVNQPSDYYTMHLLLHEGAHSLSHRFFGGAGPPWYMEGLAEYLATHEQAETEVRVGVIPASREASPYWGRIGLIAKRREEGKVPTIETVMRYGDTAHREVEPYAWSWVAAVLMETYPEYQKSYRDAAKWGRDTSPQFTRQFFQSLRSQWPVLSARWMLLCHDLEYGFERDANRVELKMMPTFSDDDYEMELMTNRGWQSSPAMVRSGQSIKIESTGRFQLNSDPAWISESPGVTITYHRGKPLGQLLACVVPYSVQKTPYLPKLDVVGIGSEGTITAAADGWLMLKINEAANGVSDNEGSLKVSLKAVQ